MSGIAGEARSWDVAGAYRTVVAHRDRPSWLRALRETAPSFSVPEKLALLAVLWAAVLTFALDERRARARAERARERSVRPVGGLAARRSEP